MQPVRVKHGTTVKNHNKNPYKVLDCYIVTLYPKTTTDNSTLLLKLRQGSQTDLVWWPILLRVVLSTQATGMGSSPSFVVRPQHSLHHRIPVSKDSTQDSQKNNINDVLNRIERSEPRDHCKRLQIPGAWNTEPLEVMESSVHNHPRRLPY